MRRSCSVVTTLIFLFIVIVVIFFISCDFSLLHSLFIFGLHILFNVCTANNNIIIVCYFSNFNCVRAHAIITLVIAYWIVRSAM